MASNLTQKQMKDASDIAVRFWEDRKGWDPKKAATSLRKEARRLREESARVERGEIGGVPHIWRFAADMLTIQAKCLAA